MGFKLIRLHLLVALACGVSLGSAQVTFRYFYDGARQLKVGDPAGNVVEYVGNAAFFSLPDSVLLFMEDINNVVNLYLVSPGHSEVLRPRLPGATFRGSARTPSMSQNGDVIAFWEYEGPLTPRDPTRNVLEIYSVPEHRWKTYPGRGEISAVAIAPDSSRVAFTAEGQERATKLLILELSTGTITDLTETKGAPGGGGPGGALSWSPDSKQLALRVWKEGGTSLIGVLDVDTGRLKVLGEGGVPAWSPTGEWIAYYDEPRERFMLVHPDGTGTKVAKRVSKSWGIFPDRIFGYPPVWSPDGRKLLLHELVGLDRIDILLLDLESGRTSRVCKKCFPVFGWAPLSKQ